MIWGYLYAHLGHLHLWVPPPFGLVALGQGTLLATAAVFLAVVSSPRAASAQSNVNIYMGQVWGHRSAVACLERWADVVEEQKWAWIRL